ncbi:hypothetical protein OH773_06735 [Buttiauxella sp. WJP83]|uniref:hypothetical protein n=1 Tax=Buttiauxella sp. WJP83 TaxID=2986951 RepID=UPI0022DDD3D2|nr:hypothetical protein [Buttiauxella sp. WJP83]WBM71931.1 hypothetical protein OH773_06735 [Buttiauxella sp. WJP83]
MKVITHKIKTIKMFNLIQDLIEDNELWGTDKDSYYKFECNNGEYLNAFLNDKAEKHLESLGLFEIL